MFEFTKPKRHVDRVFIHCTASDKDLTVGQIRAMHKRRGWNDIGYHFLIRRDGEIKAGRPLEKTPAAQLGNNTGTIAICLNGLETYTIEQIRSLIDFCVAVDDAYQDDDGTLSVPLVSFHGHCEVANKLCPVLAYREILRLDEGGHMTRTIDA